jgi:lipopolysaccharide export system permease protein
MVNRPTRNYGAKPLKQCIMFLLSRYILKNTVITTLMISIVLTLIIWLTQTLRLLDFVLNGGAPMSLFGQMLFLIVPRFFEIILPLSLALGTVYSLNKFSADSELVVMQNSGLSPLRLSHGLIIFALSTAAFIFLLSGWITPLANRQLDRLRDVVKSEYSMGLLRPGIFNSIGSSATVYIAERTNLKDLRGVFIHLENEGEVPTTITAEQGGLITQNGKPVVIVFNGTRQQFNKKTGGIDNLKFERYTLDLSSLTNSITNLQLDPNEKTIPELWATDTSNMTPKDKQRTRGEFHSRFSRSLLTIAFALMSFVPFMIGKFNRRGQGMRVTVIIVGLLALQIVHLTSASLASSSLVGVIMLYAIPGIIAFLYAAVLLNDANYYKAINPFSRITESVA